MASALLYKILPNQQRYAIEPYAENVHRLKKNIALNGIRNIYVHESAAWDASGLIDLMPSQDPSFSSVAAHGNSPNKEGRISVAAVTLDDIWSAGGSPEVSVVKIDVEGAELRALKGASELLSACRPTLLVEANTIEQLDILTRYLQGYGYTRIKPRGFARWNYVFIAMH